MDPIQDLRQRMASTTGRDTGEKQQLPPTDRDIIQPTSMSRVVWRIPAADESGLRAPSERQPRPV